MGPYIGPLARNENVSALYANFAVKYYHPGINRYLCDRNTPSGIGSPTRARTWDLRINSPSLYQLSYRGTALNYSVRERLGSNLSCVQQRVRLIPEEE